MKVLIVKISALGDVVHALPVLKYLKRSSPEIEIHWLVEQAFAAVLNGHPDIDQVHALDLKKWRKQGLSTVLKEGAGALKSLRRQRFDVAIDLQGNCKSGFFTFSCGAPKRYGFAKDQVSEWPNLMATTDRIPSASDSVHISDQLLDIVKAVVPGGDYQPGEQVLFVTDEPMQRLQANLAELDIAPRSYAVLHYGTTWPAKFWSVDSWKELANRLIDDQHLRCVLTWGNDKERAVAEDIATATSGRAVIWPRQSLEDLAALLSRAAVAIGGDTGPVHIAAALDTPTVSFYRASDGRRSGPRGDKHICLQSTMGCSPCWMKREICEWDRECMATISVDAVCDAVYSVMTTVDEETLL